MSDALDRLIAEEKASMTPPPGAKEATWAALDASIAAGAPAPIAIGGSMVKWIAAIVGGVSSVAIVAYVATRPAIEAVPLPAPPPVVVETKTIAPPPPRPPPPPIEPKRRTRPAKTDAPSLAVQLAELRKAQLAFSRGGSEQALALVKEHRKKFPKTPLEQERSALEVLASCRLRRPDGASLARTFLDRFPASPQADRIKRTCGI